MEGPLHGLLVVDLTHAYAGPLCTYNLALLGADVIKVEPPDGGDDFRVWLRPAFDAINAGKRSVTLDLKKPQARDVLYALADNADVLVENYRPGVAQRLGVDWSALRERNPRLVYCSITGYGSDGPLREAPAIEWAVQAAAGVTAEYLQEDDEATRPGLAVVDAFSGFTAVTAVLAALLRRAQTGGGCQTRYRDDGRCTRSSASVAEAVNGRRRPASPAGSGRFRARDRYSYVSAVHEKWFRGICETLGVPEIAGDARFADPTSRMLHQEELQQAFAERFVTRDAEEWQRELNEQGIPASIVRTLGEAARHEHVKQRHLLHEVNASGALISVVGNPFSLPGVDQSPRPPHVPELGEHTDEVLGEYGFDVAALRASGAVETA